MPGVRERTAAQVGEDTIAAQRQDDDDPSRRGVGRVMGLTLQTASPLEREGDAAPVLRTGPYVEPAYPSGVENR